MKKSTRFLCQIYLLAVLVVAATFASLPYLLLALLLLLAMLLSILRPLPPRLNLITTMTITFTLPLALEPLRHYLTLMALLSPTVSQFLVVIMTLPTFYLIDFYLRQNAQSIPLTANLKGKRTTTIFNTLITATLSLLLISLVVKNTGLLIIISLLVVYLLAIAIRAFYAIPRLPLQISALRKRIIAGTTDEISLDIVTKAATRLHCLFRPVNSWVKITPPRFTLDGDKTRLNLTITPLLAGPAYPELQVSVTDSHGFIQVNRVVKPLELHIIPRARYAEWLATKYLEQSGATGTVSSTLLPKVTSMPKRGTEYFDSRDYQPGDPLRNVDWKHTMKLNQLIIKEYIESGGQTAIIAVNLSVADAEEADKLAFNLITTALTLAQETIPTALTVYNHQKVILTTSAIDPREILKQTLLIVKDITSVEFAPRLLQLPDISKLRRNITLLKQATSQSVLRLLELLQFEHAALEEIAKNQPGTLALSQVTEHVSPPAIIALVTQFNHDAEALVIAIDKLAEHGFTTLPIEFTKLYLRRPLPKQALAPESSL